MEKVTYIWKNKLSRLEPLTVIQTLCNFSLLLMFKFSSIHCCLAFPGKIHLLTLNGI